MEKDFNQAMFQFVGETKALSYNFTQDYKPKDITPMQHNILEYLYLHDGVTMKALCSYLNKNITNVSREIKKLVNKDYVWKEKDESDKRKLTLKITRRGKLIIDESYFQFVREIDKKYEHLSDDERNNMIECMTYIINKLCISGNE